MQDIADLREVLQGVARGDARAQNRLVSAYGGFVHQVVRSVLHNHHDSEEVTQDIMLKVLQQADKFDMSSRFTTWLYRIAFNQAISFTRSAAFKLGQKSGPWEQYDEPEDRSGGGGDNEEAMRWGWVMARLEPEERALLVFHYSQGMPLREVAKIYSTSEGSIKVRLHRLRQRLQKELQEQPDEQPKERQHG